MGSKYETACASYGYSDDAETLTKIFESFAGATVKTVGHYLGSPCLTFEDGRMLVFQFHEGYHYSEYTHADPSFDIFVIDKE